MSSLAPLSFTWFLTQILLLHLMLRVVFFDLSGNTDGIYSYSLQKISSPLSSGSSRSWISGKFSKQAWSSPNHLRALWLESPKTGKSVPVWYFWRASARDNNNSWLWYEEMDVSMLLDPQSCCQLCLGWTLKKPEGFTLLRSLALALR